MFSCSWGIFVDVYITDAWFSLNVEGPRSMSDDRKTTVHVDGLIDDAAVHIDTKMDVVTVDGFDFERPFSVSRVHREGVDLEVKADDGTVISLSINSMAFAKILGAIMMD